MERRHFDKPVTCDDEIIAWKCGCLRVDERLDLIYHGKPREIIAAVDLAARAAWESVKASQGVVLVRVQVCETERASEGNNQFLRYVVA